MTPEEAIVLASAHDEVFVVFDAATGEVLDVRSVASDPDKRFRALPGLARDRPTVGRFFKQGALTVAVLDAQRRDCLRIAERARLIPGVERAGAEQIVRYLQERQGWISADWYYAVGGFQFRSAGTGHITRDGKTGATTIDMSIRLYVRDRYNWDGDKAVNISVGPKEITISDKQLQDLHKSGLAAECEIRGTSFSETNVTWTTGGSLGGTGSGAAGAPAAPGPGPSSRGGEGEKPW